MPKARGGGKPSIMSYIQNKDTFNSLTEPLQAGILKEMQRYNNVGESDKATDNQFMYLATTERVIIADARGQVWIKTNRGEQSIRGRQQTVYEFSPMRRNGAISRERVSGIIGASRRSFNYRKRQPSGVETVIADLQAIYRNARGL